MIKNDDDELNLLRSSALQNSHSILSARRRVEEELLKNSEWLEVTLASIGDAVVSSDTSGHVIYMNGVAESLTGWQESDAVGQPLSAIFNIVNEYTRDPVSNPAIRALNEGVVVGLANHTVLIAKDGSERLIDDSAAPIRGKDGKILGSVLVFRDVTDRKEVELALQRSERELRDFFENAPVGFHLAEENGTIIRANQIELDMLGYELGDYVGRNISEFYVDPKAAEDVLRKLAAGETLRNHSAQLRCKDGSVLDLLINANALFESGRFVHSRSFNRDVTELKRAEVLLREGEARKATMFETAARLASIVESSDDAIVSKDLNGTIVSWNRGAEKMFGYTAEEAIGRLITMIIPEERLSEEAVVLGRLREGKKVEHFETQRLTKDGRLLDISLTVSPVKDDAGQIIGASKIARDITERNAAVESLRKLAAELSEADRRKNEFLAMLAHELRNPLAPIRNALQIVRRTGQANETYEIMDRQVDQLVRLVDDLLDVSRISTGKIELRLIKTDLVTIVRHAVEAARSSFDAAGISIHVIFPDEPLYLNGDPARLTQAIGNLLNNSCKFTPQGGRVEIIVERDQAEAVVIVRDTGIGIAADDLQHVFDLFVQADTSLQRTTGGLGIGLTLVKKLIEMHEGRIEVSSSGIGEGTEFVIRVPALRTVSGSNEISSVEEDRSPVRRLRILVVDDNVDSAESLNILMTLEGHEADMVHDGINAMKKAEEFRPDVILLDIGLPGMNGYEVARQIRKQPWGEKMALIALTGWGQNEDRERSKAAGFDTHLVKPIEHRMLNLLLEEISLQPNS